MLAEVIRDVDLPPGVINIVTGAGETGSAIVEHPEVNKLAFTGSTEVGKLIQRSAVKRNLPLTLELGGKAPHVIFEDAALDQAIEGVINGIFFNQGHVCCAGSRLLVQESIADNFIDRLQKRIELLRVGNPLDKNTDIGAINSKAQLERIDQLVKAGIEEGAEVFKPSCSLPDNGYWYPPTVLTGVQQSHRVAREEIFGPVLPVKTYSNVSESVDYINSKDRPLGLYYFGKDKEEQDFVLNNTTSGGVTVNDVISHIQMEDLPFGGVGPSGMGSYHGHDGFKEFSHAKATYTQSKLNLMKIAGLVPPYKKKEEKPSA